MDSDHIHPPLPPSQLFLLVPSTSSFQLRAPILLLLITLSPISPVHLSMGVSPAAGVWEPPSSHIPKGEFLSLPSSLYNHQLLMAPPPFVLSFWLAWSCAGLVQVATHGLLWVGVCSSHTHYVRTSSFHLPLHPSALLLCPLLCCSLSLCRADLIQVSEHLQLLTLGTLAR